MQNKLHYKYTSCRIIKPYTQQYWGKKRNKLKHPIQPIETDKVGTARFKANAIVMYLLDTSVNDMNDLAVMDFSNEDREQFAQLIGYSLSGFGELSYVSDETYEAAERMFEDGQSEADARIEQLQSLVNELRENLRQPIARLFGIHPGDLGITR